MTRLMQRIISVALILALVGVRALVAQVSIPNIQNPINKARAAAGKTSDQINATNSVGNEKSAPVPPKGVPATGQALAKSDTAASVQLGGSRRSQVTIYRETFAYSSGGHRDPFVSLMASGELRPLITDLVLTGVIYDSEGRRSVALLVDASTGESYRVRNGQTLARMKVTKIGKEDITFSIDEFGLSRSETLIIDKTRKGPIAGPRRP